MLERHDYLGHQILLTLERREPSGYEWSWRIDDLHTAKGARDLPEAEARTEALYLAHRLLDRWDHQQSLTASQIFAERFDPIPDPYAEPTAA